MRLAGALSASHGGLPVQYGTQAACESRSLRPSRPGPVTAFKFNIRCSSRPRRRHGDGRGQCRAAAAAQSGSGWPSVSVSRSPPSADVTEPGPAAAVTVARAAAWPRQSPLALRLLTQAAAAGSRAGPHSVRLAGKVTAITASGTDTRPTDSESESHWQSGWPVPGSATPPPLQVHWQVVARSALVPGRTRAGGDPGRNTDDRLCC